LAWAVLVGRPAAPTPARGAWPEVIPAVAPGPEVAQAELVAVRDGDGARTPPAPAPESAAAADPGAFEVRVVDLAGQPLAGAHVRCATATAALEATADDQGRARFALPRLSTARASRPRSSDTSTSSAR
jgi:hypothetical protein